MPELQQHVTSVGPYDEYHVKQAFATHHHANFELLLVECGKLLIKNLL